MLKPQKDDFVLTFLLSLSPPLKLYPCGSGVPLLGTETLVVEREEGVGMFFAVLVLDADGGRGGRLGGDN